MNIEQNIQEILKHISSLTTDEQIETINSIKLELHKISPLRNEPVDCVLLEQRVAELESKSKKRQIFICYFLDLKFYTKPFPLVCFLR